jgi:hypothetical protein
VNTFSAAERCYYAGVCVFPLKTGVYAEEGIMFIATAAATATPAELDPLQGVRTVVQAIREARPLAASHNLDTLLRRAAASRGTPADIDAWSRDIAEKTGKLND